MFISLCIPTNSYATFVLYGAWKGWNGYDYNQVQHRMTPDPSLTNTYPAKLLVTLLLPYQLPRYDSTLSPHVVWGLD